MDFVMENFGESRSKCARTTGLERFLRLGLMSIDEVASAHPLLAFGLNRNEFQRRILSAADE
jgi:hypothetical protein